MRKTYATIALAALGLVVAGLLAVPAFAADKPAAKPALTTADCAKCHDAPPADIAAAGGLHKTEISCTECHGGHRPSSKNNIPKCSDCHDGAEHYKLKNCAECHKNPHRPLDILLTAKMTDPCLTCHKEQIKQLKENASKHTSLYCTSCHDVHRRIPQCVKCHKPHSAEMTQADCGKCHRAHQPANVVFNDQLPNKDCGGCHKQALTRLAASAFKHKTVSCVTCHKAKHKVVPTCESCHPDKHTPNILKKFPKCGMCHYTAHDLNNFPEAAKPPSGDKPAAAPASAPKKP